MKKEKLLISACMMGTNCRYDGGNTKLKELEALAERYELIPVCPETLSGLPCPRTPSEIVGGKVMNAQNEDATQDFQRGAELALEIWKHSGCPKALLQSRSPSCGKGVIYDGTFTGRKIAGNGIFAQMLMNEGAQVYSELELAEVLKAN